MTFVLWILLSGIYGIHLGHILFLSAGITCVTFFIGELYILFHFKNRWATMFDFLFVLGVVWGLVSLLYQAPILLYKSLFSSPYSLQRESFCIHPYSQQH